MKTKRLIPYFNNSQKFRAIVDGVGLYMTVSQLETTFATSSHRIAVWQALEALGISRHKEPNTTGLGTTITVYDDKIKPTRIPVQVDLL